MNATLIPSAAADGSRGSNVFKVNHWLWRLGAGGLALGLSVSETEERRYVVVKAGAKRSHETRRRCEAARGGVE